MAGSVFRLRIAFEKADRLRFLSHLEVVRTMERTARRADLPYAVTKGFSPHMRLAFGPALPVGTAGHREHVDLWLTEYLPAEECVARLAAVSVAGLAPYEARYVSEREPSLTAACNIGVYEVVVDGDGAGAEAVSAALTALVAGREFAIEHKGKRRVYDLARSLPKEPRVEGRDREWTVHLTVRMGPEGSLRPDALVREAIDRCGVDAQIRLVTRTDTLIEDSEGVWRRPL